MAVLPVKLIRENISVFTKVTLKTKAYNVTKQCSSTYIKTFKFSINSSLYFCLMENGRYFCYNAKVFKTGKAVISADNRSFRYGDGFFETMKMIKGNIVLKDYHFERLFSSLQLLKFEKPAHFTVAYLSGRINDLVLKNKHAEHARIRLTIFRGDGGLYDAENNLPHYIIQSWQLSPGNFSFNKKGLITGIYTNARKTCDGFSAVKTNNYLAYLMAALWAKENKLDDAFVLNNYDRIADATIANIFLVKDGTIKTPALSEGCISGVMRRYLLKALQKENIPFEETMIEKEDLAEADEVFTTNAAQGIRWVKQCGKYNYRHEFSEYSYNKFLSPLFNL
ncbi:MAG TPA: aminotransferase class IV [Parafilimonas sp.]|nr:aminotransferase class IV [Parafilimonas sp.]